MWNERDVEETEKRYETDTAEDVEKNRYPFTSLWNRIVGECSLPLEISRDADLLIVLHPHSSCIACYYHRRVVVYFTTLRCHDGVLGCRHAISCDSGIAG